MSDTVRLTAFAHAGRTAAETIDTLVSALEPFANMPMPDKHSAERERIHKARAALALARMVG
jgi:hypothetical protein